MRNWCLIAYQQSWKCSLMKLLFVKSSSENMTRWPFYVWLLIEEFSMIITEHIWFCLETVIKWPLARLNRFLIFFCIVLQLLLFIPETQTISNSCYEILGLFPKRECQFVSFVCHSGQTRVKAVLNQFDQNWESFRLFCGHFCNLSK